MVVRYYDDCIWWGYVFSSFDSLLIIYSLIFKMFSKRQWSDFVHYPHTSTLPVATAGAKWQPVDFNVSELSQCLINEIPGLRMNSFQKQSGMKICKSCSFKKKIIPVLCCLPAIGFEGYERTCIWHTWLEHWKQSMPFTALDYKFFPRQGARTKHRNSSPRKGQWKPSQAMLTPVV